MTNHNCPKCHGKGFFKKEDGSVSTCFDCLNSGDMDQHNDQIKDASDYGIKI